MTTPMRPTLFALAVLTATACGKDHPQCEKFVDLAFKCDDDLESSPADEKKTARLMMGSMCEEAFKNDTSSVSGESKKMVTEMYQELRKRADCAAKASTCDQYEACSPD
jgi:hypothetical protein